MVEYTAQDLTRTFHALAHPLRRTVIARLAHEPASVTDVAGWFAISLNGVSKHLKVLEHAGLLTRTIEGRTHYLSLHAVGLHQASDWIAAYRPFWESRFDALERLLDSDDDTPTNGT